MYVIILISIVLLVNKIDDLVMNKGLNYVFGEIEFFEMRF